MKTEYKECIEACMQCISACNQCASVCVDEDEAPENFTRCIQLNMKCGTICFAAVQLMSLGSESAEEITTMCAEACDACAAECSRFEDEPFQQCLEACVKCAEACRSLPKEQEFKYWLLN
jgi:hypothetical protein